MSRDMVFMVRSGIIGVCEFDLEELFPEAMEEPDQLAMQVSCAPKETYVPIEGFYGDITGKGIENEYTLDPLSLLTRDDEMWDQRLEYWTELMRREEEQRPPLSSNVFRQKDGIYVLPCQQPDAQTIAVAVAGDYVPYICNVKHAPVQEDEYLPANLQFGGKVPLLRLPRRKWIQKEERYYDSHGWRGRLTNQRVFNQRQALRGRGRFATLPAHFSHDSFRKPAPTH